MLEKLQEVGQESSIKLSDVMRICAECGMAGTAQEPLEDQVAALSQHPLSYPNALSTAKCSPTKFWTWGVIGPGGGHRCLILTPLVLS